MDCVTTCTSAFAAAHCRSTLAQHNVRTVQYNQRPRCHDIAYLVMLYFPILSMTPIAGYAPCISGLSVSVSDSLCLFQTKT